MLRAGPELVLKGPFPWLGPAFHRAVAGSGSGLRPSGLQQPPDGAPDLGEGMKGRGDQFVDGIWSERLWRSCSPPTRSPGGRTRQAATAEVEEVHLVESRPAQRSPLAMSSSPASRDSPPLAHAALLLRGAPYRCGSWTGRDP